MRSPAALAAAGAALLTLAGGVLLLSGRPDPPIRIGITSRPVHELLVLAREQELFEKEGAKVKLLEFPSVVDARRAYERSQIDGFVGTLVEMAELQDDPSRRPVAFSVVGVSHGGDVLLSRPAIASVAALRGRRVGLEVGTSSELLLSRALASIGLRLADVERVHVHPEDAPAALAQGSVDAIVVHAPASVLAERSGAGRALFSTALMPGEIADLILIDPEILEARPDEAAAVLRAIERAERRAAHGSAAAYRIMGRPEGLTGGEMREAIEGGFVLPSPAEQALLLAPGGQLDRELRRLAASLRTSGVEAAPAAGSAPRFTPAIAERAARG